jgi:hypothetical protein
MNDERKPSSATPAQTSQVSQGRLPRRFWGNWLALLVVFVVAFSVAGLTYRYFLDSPEHLWPSGGHDRNGHYRLGQSMALHLRHGQLLSWLHDVNSAQIWPPLHGILVGMVLAVGGIDYRLAVLPSLAAWFMSCVLVFLISRRLMPRGGNVAGLAAVIFFLASPAHRAYATDVMLESLGAALTLAVLYFYIRVKQDETPGAGCCLGLALTALFLTKYNYWMLAAVGLLVPTMAANWSTIRATFIRAGASRAWRPWIVKQLRNPITYLLVPALLLTATVTIAVMVLRGPLVIQIGSHRLEFYRSQGLITVAYLLFVLRISPWWWKIGRHEVRRWSSPKRQVMLWHVYAIGLWFLWPKRLANFLWYVTFTNHGGTGASSSLGGNFSYYLSCMLEDYHASAMILILAVSLAGVAVLLARQLRPGAVGFVCFLIVAVILTNYHSASRGRFLHSWIAAVWVTSGVGLASIIFSPLTSRLGSLRYGLAGGSLTAMGLMLLPGILQRGHAGEGGPLMNHPSMLVLTNRFLPELAESRRPTLLSNGLIQPFLEWTFSERYGVRQADVNMGWAKNATDQVGFDSWLRATQSDKLVYVELTGQPSFDSAWPPGDPLWMRRRLAGQGCFVPVRQWQFPEYGDVTVSIWQRADSARASR